jgi:hypothetical protein
MTEAEQERSGPGISALGYFLFPPVWLGGSPADAIPTEPRGVWDRIAEVKLPQGIKAWCFRNGLFAFDLSNWEFGAHTAWADPTVVQARDRWRTYVMNTHLACLFTASKGAARTLTPMIVGPDDIVHFHDNGVVSCGGMLATTGALNAKWESHGEEAPDDWRLKRGTTLSLDAINKSYALLDSILRHQPATEILPLIDLTLRAAVAHMSKTPDAALIQAWAAIERILTSVWESYLADNRARENDAPGRVFINSDRRGLLTGRDFTISVVSEILSLLDQIPPDLYRRLAPVRQARNRWMHQLTPTSAAESAQGLQLAFDLLRHVHNVDLDLVPEIMFARGF